jgi:hypothetical protein
VRRAGREELERPLLRAQGREHASSKAGGCKLMHGVHVLPH